MKTIAASHHVSYFGFFQLKKYDQRGKNLSQKQIQTIWAAHCEDHLPVLG